VANMFVAACGKSTLGLAYGLSVAEALLAPAMPSTTARAGGIFMPIINSLSLAADSKPGAPLLQGMAEVGMPHQARGNRARSASSINNSLSPAADSKPGAPGGAARIGGTCALQGWPRGLGRRHVSWR